MALAEGGKGIVYYVFDLIELDGKDLRKTPLIKRKETLATLLEDQPQAGPLIYSDHVTGHGGEIFARACDMGLEGIVSKRADAPYRSGAEQELAEDQMRHGPGVHHHRLAAVDVKGRPFSSMLVAVREGNGWSIPAGSGAVSASGSWRRCGRNWRSAREDAAGRERAGGDPARRAFRQAGAGGGDRVPRLDQ